MNFYVVRSIGHNMDGLDEVKCMESETVGILKEFFCTLV